MKHRIPQNILERIGPIANPPVGQNFAFFFVLMLLFFSIGACDSRPYLSEEQKAAYQKSADQFCRAITRCIKEDVQERLAHEPRYRAHVVSRMDRDLCMKGQYNLIGSLSVDPQSGPPLDQKKLYDLYSECSNAVAGAPDCETRKELHRTYKSCTALRARLKSLEPQ